GIDPPALIPLDDPVTTTTPTLQWSPVTGAVGYEVYLDDATSQAPVIAGFSTTDTRYTVPPLTEGHSYRWWVVPRDGAGNRGPAPAPLAFDIRTLTSAAGVPAPLEPSGVVRTPPTLRWGAADGAVYYVVTIEDVTLG